MNPNPNWIISGRRMQETLVGFTNVQLECRDRDCIGRPRVDSSQRHMAVGRSARFSISSDAIASAPKEP